MVTLYHWDLPMSIQNLGGWINPNTIQYFKDYASVALKTFTDVDYWITFNEPCQICNGGYGNGDFAPFIHGDGELDYICAKNVLLAHAEVYHLKEKMSVKGSMSMTINFPWAIPKTNLQPDREAAERFRQFLFGLYANPIYKGDWPSVVKGRVAERSLNEYGTVEKSRLPEIDVEKIKGTADFIAVNYYDSHIIENNVEDLDYTQISFQKDLRIKMSTDESWEIGYNGRRFNPEGLRDSLYWLRSNYGNDKQIIITENGMADIDSYHKDTKRKEYISNHLNAVLDAIEWGVNVVGYTYWSFLDNFEWTHGYKPKYGLYHVDFTNKNRTRTPKGAVDFYKRIISNRELRKY